MDKLKGSFYNFANNRITLLSLKTKSGKSLKLFLYKTVDRGSA